MRCEWVREGTGISLCIRRVQGVCCWRWLEMLTGVRVDAAVVDRYLWRGGECRVGGYLASSSGGGGGAAARAEFVGAVGAGGAGDAGVAGMGAAGAGSYCGGAWAGVVYRDTCGVECGEGAERGFGSAAGGSVSVGIAGGVHWR